MAKVQVEHGFLEGEKLQLVTGDGDYFSFKGIPYAAPPVGTLRFKAPQPLKPWNGVRKATKHGPVCPQRDIFTQELIITSDDCLYLNVYTKNLKPKAPLAVMVFIHGGGYKSGSGNVDNYGPDFLVNQDVVLVTINYRLEALGFLCLDTEDVPGNAERNIYGGLGAPFGIEGASHLDDLMYLFDAKKANLSINKSSKSYQMIQQTCALFTNFAKYGNPTEPKVSLGLNWPQYDAESEHYLDIGQKLVVGQRLRAETFAFWQSVYNEAGWK